MGNHLLFIGNVAAHLVALMSGIASFVLATISAIKRKPVIERWFWIAGAICLIAAFDGAWQDEHRNTQTVIQEKATEASQKNSCLQDARVEQAYRVGLEGLNFDQTKTIDNQRDINAKQQTAVNSCVVSLGKMNPVVHREVRVIVIPYGTAAKNSGAFVSRFAKVPEKVYMAELIITTNEDEIRPSGYLRCNDAFEVAGLPQLPSIKGGMIAPAMPEHVSDREYKIDISDTGSYWGPSTPIYMPIRSDTEILAGCSFTPQ